MKQIKLQSTNFLFRLSNNMPRFATGRCKSRPGMKKGGQFALRRSVFSTIFAAPLSGQRKSCANIDYFFANIADCFANFPRKLNFSTH
ncbi:hypothetical protein KP005_12060 [Geomonas nitrogeniifigens]|uniref:Uncharacterized protein n=1 Tax=Geomonas diazotrophica TaxID=2843197 RepID=A0ABX8JCG7_9BACT|nr:hypothetical protein [Geomonas nitrogeniifigens]QWV96115.1 hypothetical protein KP005_12060 [Geomonas nitrogeniifigens]